MHSAHFLKMVRKWRKWSMGYEELSSVDASYPSFKKRGHRGRRNAVTVVVGKEKEVFRVEPQILDYGLFQSLLQRATIERIHWDGKENEYKPTPECIFLNCDAILFEHMLWLVNNDDPCLRYLNLESRLVQIEAPMCCTRPILKGGNLEFINPVGSKKGPGSSYMYILLWSCVFHGSVAMELVDLGSIKVMVQLHLWMELCPTTLEKNEQVDWGSVEYSVFQTSTFSGGVEPCHDSLRMGLYFATTPNPFCQAYISHGESQLDLDCRI
eukprot:Gb_28615 [translate_table: standard]